MNKYDGYSATGTCSLLFECDTTKEAVASTVAKLVSQVNIAAGNRLSSCTVSTVVLTSVGNVANQ